MTESVMSKAVGLVRQLQGEQRYGRKLGER